MMSYTLRADPKRKRANIKRFMQPMAKNDSFRFFLGVITRDNGFAVHFVETRLSSVRSSVMEQSLADPSPMRTLQIYMYFFVA